MMEEDEEKPKFRIDKEEISKAFKKFIKEIKLTKNNFNDVWYESNIVKILEKYLGKDVVSQMNLNLEKKMSLNRDLRVAMKKHLGIKIKQVEEREEDVAQEEDIE